MTERMNAYRKTIQEVESIFDSLGQPTINPVTGDKIWTTPHEEKSPFDEGFSKFTLALSPLGEKVFRNIRFFLREMESGKFEPLLRSLDEITGLRGIVKRTRVGGILSGTSIYIKTLRPIAEPYLDTTGIEQFTAMRLLETNGIAVASPLLATNYRIVTREVIGKHVVDEKSTAFGKYLENLNQVRKELISQGVWNKEWRIEEQPYNYLQTEKGIVAIDPISRRSVLFLG